MRLLSKPCLIVAAALGLCLPHPGSAANAGPANALTWITLGTGGGPIVRVKRAQTSNALVRDHDVILFDAGEGAVHGLAKAGLRLGQVRAVVLSHLHPDHTAGLAALIALRWQTGVSAPLIVYGPVGTDELVAAILAANRPAERVGFAAPGARIPSASDSVVAREMRCAGETTVISYANVAAVGNSHYTLPDGSEPGDARSCSFRITVGQRKIAYTGDTGPSKAITALATDVDLLVSEVIDVPATLAEVERGSPMFAQMRQGLTYHLTRHHLTPEDVGRIAVSAGVGAVVLTHIAPGLDDETDDSKYSRGVALLFHGPVIVARDGLSFAL